MSEHNVKEITNDLWKRLHSSGPTDAEQIAQNATVIRDSYLREVLAKSLPTPNPYTGNRR